MPDQLLARLVPWFAERMAVSGRGGSSLDRVYPLSDGHSSVTLGVDVSWSSPSAGSDTFVLRTSPQGVGLLEPYDIAKQARIMADLAGTAITVPQVLWHEDDPSVLGRSFLVMTRVDGEIIEYTVPEWMEQASDESRRSMSTQIVETIAALHRVPCDTPSFDYLRPSGVADPTSRELGRWVAMVEEAKPGPMPGFDTLIQWLHDHRPDGSGRTTILHGDLKWGNFVFDRDRLVALLDWEMAAIGDPLIDIGYALMYWDTSPAALPGGLTRREFIDLYELRTGIEVVDVEWFENLNTLKLAAILLRGTAMFERGDTNDLRFAWMATFMPTLIGRALARAGIEGVEQPPWNPDPRRVAQAAQRQLTERVLPGLIPERRRDANALHAALQYLGGDAAAGAQFDLVSAGRALGAPGDDT